MNGWMNKGLDVVLSGEKKREMKEENKETGIECWESGKHTVCVCVYVLCAKKSWEFVCFFGISRGTCAKKCGETRC